jgi:hypothetical protein
MIDRITAYAARHFGGVGTTRASLVRIHAWILVFLVVVASLAPTHGINRRLRAALGPVHSLRRDFNDQQAFTASPFGKRAFHIAWIFGSEGDVTKTPVAFPPTIGNFLQQSLPKIGDRYVAIDAYDLSSMKLGDAYMTLLDALATKPDLVMLSLNPAWVMNPYAVHRWPNLDARAALALAQRPSKWLLGASLLSPADLLWGIANSQLTPFGERFYWSGRVHALVDHIGPLDRSQLAIRSFVRRPDRSQVLLGSQPINFFSAYRLHVISPKQLGTLIQTPQGPRGWARWIDATSNRGGNQMNGVLLRAIASELRAAHVPSVVYLAQMNRSWLLTSPSFAKSVRGVERQVATFGAAFNARNILFEPEVLSRSVTDLVYKDETHITGAGTLGPYFATQVCRVLAQVGRGAGCQPLAQGSAR